LTSPRARAEPVSLDELERLLDAVEAELLALRARGAPAPKGAIDRDSRQRIERLEQENQLLQQRIGAAREMVQQLQTRLRFVEGRGDSA